MTKPAPTQAVAPTGQPSRELLERIAERLSKAQIFDLSSELRAALASPVAPSEPSWQRIKIPTETMEQEFQSHYRRGFEAGKLAASGQAEAPAVKHSLTTEAPAPPAKLEELSYHCIGYIKHYGTEIRDMPKGKQNVPVYVRAHEYLPTAPESKPWTTYEQIYDIVRGTGHCTRGQSDEITELLLTALAEPEGAPVAAEAVTWLYELQTDGHTVNKFASDNRQNYPFGISGRDFACGATVVETPLYPAPQAPAQPAPVAQAWKAPDLFAIARQTGLRQAMHGINAATARAMLEKFLAAVLEYSPRMLADASTPSPAAPTSDAERPTRERAKTARLKMAYGPTLDGLAPWLRSQESALAVAPWQNDHYVMGHRKALLQWADALEIAARAQDRESGNAQ